MQSIAEATSAAPAEDGNAAAAASRLSQADALQHKANRVRWLKLNFTVKAARLQTLKRQKYQHLQEEALLKARGLLHNWENNAVVLTEDLYRLAAGEREAEELMNYTPEALALRFSLRNDAKVLEAVRQLWQIEMPRDALGCIDQRGYADVFRRIAKSLDAKAFKKKQKVDKLLGEDWKRDSKGESTMGFANFFDSIFELADLWCETIDADDYVGFLNRIRDRISHVQRGKRAFKPMPKVLAFDADSDEEDEEEDEEEADEEDDEDEVTKPPPPQPAPPPQPKILVAKAIKPVVQQPQSVAANALRKVSRVAISSSKVLHRKEPPGATSSKAHTAIVVSPAPGKESVASAPAIPPAPAQDNPSPLMHQQSSPQSMGNMPARQRRASVVTTIQFMDEGFMRSVAENIANTSGMQSPSVAAALPLSVAAAIAASARREQGLRPSLAAAANAALANQPSPAEAAPSAVPEPPELTSPPSERKRVITVSTAKHAVLKSVVFATRKAGKPTLHEEPLLSLRDEQLQQQQHEPFGEEGNDESDETRVDKRTASAGGATKTRGGPVGGPSTSGNPLANTVAIRIRTGSLFDVDDDNTTHNSTAPPTAAAKGGRLGFGKAGVALAKRGHGGLAPLTSPSQLGNGAAFAGSIGNPRNTLTAIPHGPHGGPTVVFSGMSSNGGIDFSDSVVMTNYVVDRPAMAHGTQSLRAPIVLGGNTKKPALGTLQASTGSGVPGASQSAGIQGTRVLAKQTPTFETAEEIVPPPTRDLTRNRPMVVVVNKTPLPQQSASPDPGHRFTGSSNLCGVGHHQFRAPAGISSLTPEGDPEHALRIKTALDRDHGPVRGKDALVHVVVPHERHFDHTDPEVAPAPELMQIGERHGLVIQAFPHGSVKPSHDVRTIQTSPERVVSPSPQSQYMDPIGTPWDTFDDDDDTDDITNGSSTSSARSLLQPENAMEALAKVISKRTASHSAGSTRNYRTVAVPSSASSVRRHSRATTLDGASNGPEADTFEDRSALARPMPRTRLLTVSSLGGSSVETLAQSKLSVTPVVRRGSGDEFGRDPGALLGSASAPALPTMDQLELNYSRPLQSPSPSDMRRQRTRLTIQTDGPLLKLPVRGRGHDLDSVDDLELRGELAMDPSRSPPRSPTMTAPRTSPIKICTCTRRRGPESSSDENDGSHSWPPPVYRLDRSSTSANDQHREDEDPNRSPEKCAACQRKRDTGLSGDATIILNATRELVLAPHSKEQDVVALASRATPTRSEMMRRRHRYTHGRPT